jgi:hypothetical protein
LLCTDPAASDGVSNDEVDAMEENSLLSAVLCGLINFKLQELLVVVESFCFDVEAILSLVSRNMLD